MSGLIKPPFGTPLNLGHPLARGLVGCWLFNEGSGNKAYDPSGQENHGTLTNMNNPPISTSGWVSGPHGGALAFDGSNDYVLMNRALIATDNFSIIVLICPNNGAVGATQVGFANGNTSLNGYYLRWRDSQWYFAMSGINYGSAVNGIIGSYQHIACIRDNSTNIIYLNGVYNNVGTYIPNFPVGETRIGINDDHASNAFNGLISDFFIYTRALSQTEVALLHAYPYCMFEEPDYPAWMAPSVAGQAISKRFGGVPHMAINKGVW